MEEESEWIAKGQLWNFGIVVGMEPSTPFLLVLSAGDLMRNIIFLFRGVVPSLPFAYSTVSSLAHSLSFPFFPFPSSARGGNNSHLSNDALPGQKESLCRDELNAVDRVGPALLRVYLEMDLSTGRHRGKYEFRADNLSAPGPGGLRSK